MTTPQLRCGTRRSPLALAQARQFAQAVTTHYGWPQEAVEIVTFSTRGDEMLNQPLAEIGGKGLFTQELEKALREGVIDFAVHSLKDLPVAMAAHLRLGCIPPRETPYDVLLWRKGAGESAGDGKIGEGGKADNEATQKLDALAEQKASIGTASLRRAAQLKYAYPRLTITPLRGNIGTRLDKLSDGARAPQATLLAAAGIARLQKADADFAAQLKNDIAHYVLPPELMLPAPAQGALGIQCRQNDSHVLDILSPLNCPTTTLCVTAERSFLRALGGDCHTPIAALAHIENNELHLMTRLLSVDGAECHEMTLSGQNMEAEDLGLLAANAYIKTAPQLVPKKPPEESPEES